MQYLLPMVNDTDLLTNLYNAFNPFEPLPAGDPKYVDCQQVRGDADILNELGNRMRLANNNTCQLYSGHRGGGKSTELLRLKQYLEIGNSMSFILPLMKKILTQKMPNIQIFSSPVPDDCSKIYTKLPILVLYSIGSKNAGKM
jgi:hypothetical protein